MAGGLTYDDVYEIAAEVAEEVVTKFLSNLVKLVPSSEEVVEDIQERQYQELKQLRQNKMQESASNKHVDYAPDELVNMGSDEDIAAIAHPEKAGGEESWAAKNNFDDVLSSVTLEKSDLVGEINQAGE